MTSERHDLVVIGGGLAGLTAALRSSELGLRVAVIEAGTADRYLCNSRLAMGFFNVAFRDIWEGEEVLQRAINAVTADAASPELTRALSRNAQHALAWLRAQGVHLVVGNWRPGSHAMLAPPAAIGAGLRWPGRGADQMLRRLEALLLARGGSITRGMRARELIMSANRCIGIVAESDKGRRDFAAEAVLIADGGFQNSRELLREFLTEYPERLLMRNAGTALGDGLRMARAVGARIVETGDFYGHVQAANAMQNPRLWPYPYLDNLIAVSVLLNAEGKRFTDEGLGGVFVANAIARQKDPLGTFVVFDRAIWDGRARDFPLPVNPLLAKSDAAIHRAETLEGLAAALKVRPDAFLATLAEYNAAIAADAVQGLVPPRSVHLFKPMPIGHSPYFAAPAVAGLTYTMGGIAIDGEGRVQHNNGGAIDGLFAAGSTTGGHEGGPKLGYTGGFSKALTFGWCAANAIARDHARTEVQRIEKQESRFEESASRTQGGGLEYL